MTLSSCLLVVLSALVSIVLCDTVCRPLFPYNSLLVLSFVLSAQLSLSLNLCRPCTHRPKLRLPTLSITCACDIGQIFLFVVNNLHGILFSSQKMKFARYCGPFLAALLATTQSADAQLPSLNLPGGLDTLTGALGGGAETLTSIVDDVTSALGGGADTVTSLLGDGANSLTDVLGGVTSQLGNGAGVLTSIIGDVTSIIGGNLPTGGATGTATTPTNTGTNTMATSTSTVTTYPTSHVVTTVTAGGKTTTSTATVYDCECTTKYVTTVTEGKPCTSTIVVHTKSSSTMYAYTDSAGGSSCSSSYWTKNYGTQSSPTYSYVAPTTTSSTCKASTVTDTVTCTMQIMCTPSVVYKTATPSNCYYTQASQSQSSVYSYASYSVHKRCNTCQGVTSTVWVTPTAYAAASSSSQRNSCQPTTYSTTTMACASTMMSQLTTSTGRSFLQGASASFKQPGSHVYVILASTITALFVLPYMIMRI
ncbi:hypothetical protein BCV70DRAFT_201154 [Testicularia cyperi]|uniref:Uncharacterized protein n=1 Tax=Testicularia cyperi TaxID=1882483 RepID=A0A317XKW5_9BASI|nr:hypothetical protein BCV70DRAFT_201154 [Testicularia cyperi]